MALLRRAMATALIAAVIVVPPRAAIAAGQYSVGYNLDIDAKNGIVAATMIVEQSSHLLREVRFDRRDQDSDYSGDGDVEIGTNQIVWTVPPGGGALSWRAKIAAQRRSGGFDAWLDESFGLFRAEDAIPRMSTRTLRGSSSVTSMSITTGNNWSSVTQYPLDDAKYAIDNPQRRFDQPNGWIAVGELGVRREKIAGIRVAITGPVGHHVRRMDMLALLAWTLPELRRVLPELPDRLTVFSAGNPMWRGGLSAPKSLFVHAERPLISENSTSTLLHEVMHVALRISAEPGFDWIVEGIAEYFTLELLRRSGTISQKRYTAAREALHRWAQSSKNLCADRSSGATTARAVGVIAALDDELRRRTASQSTIDDVAARLQQQQRPVSLSQLQAIVRDLTGKESDVLDVSRLPGCRSIPATDSD